MQPNPESAPPEAERTEQAARLVAMLKRWATEDVSHEPDWDIEALERVRLSGQPGRLWHDRLVRLLLDPAGVGEICHPLKFKSQTAARLALILGYLSRTR